jgi:pyruvate kinase
MVSPDQVRVRIKETPSKRVRLKADKGINFPDSALDLPSITAEDRENLGFVARHADLVGLSFVNHEKDVERLIEHLKLQGPMIPGIVVKIETRRATTKTPNSSPRFHHALRSEDASRTTGSKDSRLPLEAIGLKAIRETSLTEMFVGRCN